MSKLSFDDALQMVAEDRCVSADKIQARALKRTVWLMLYSAPGCMPDHRDVCRTRSEAIETAINIYADDAPKGFRTRLRKYGIAATDPGNYYRVEIVRTTLGDIL